MTTLPISYNVAQNIFKYLDVDKRLQISVQCPKLRTAERKADLKLHSLNLNEKDLYIHKMCFTVLKNEEGEVGTIMEIGKFRKEKKKFAVTGHKDFLKKTLSLYLADRGRVRIETMICYQPNSIKEYLPEDFKFDCGTLYTGRVQLKTLRIIRPYLNLPVEFLPIFVTKPEDPIFEEEMVRTATKLIVRTESEESLIDDLLKLRNPTIEFHLISKNSFSAEDVMTIVKDWMARCPPVTTELIWETRNEKLVEVAMDDLRKELGAVSKGGWPDSKINDAVLLMSSGHWLRIKAVDDLIRMDVRENDSY